MKMKKTAFGVEGFFFFFPLLWEFTRTNSNILQERQNKFDNSHLGKENNI